MKLSASQYAKALLAALDDRSGAEQKQIIAAFLRLIKRRGDGSLLKKIVTQVQAQADAAAGLVKAEVITARPLSETARHDLKTLVKEKSGARSVELTEVVDPTVLGGCRLSYQNKCLDASWQTFLKQLQTRLI